VTWEQFAQACPQEDVVFGMGGRRCAAGGLVALLGMVCAVPAYAGPVRVVEAERMDSAAGVVVHARAAAGGRALELRPTHSARTRIDSPAVGEVVLRARAAGCGSSRSLAVSVDGIARGSVTPRRRWRDLRVKLALAPGSHKIEVAFTGPKRKRCRVLIDRLRLNAPKPAPAPAPVLVRQEAPVEPVRRVPLGAAVQHGYIFKDASFDAAFRREFASLTPENEMKMSVLQPQRDKWNFRPADDLVAYARKHGKAVRGHALVFGAANPPWADRLLLAADAEKALRDHIFKVVGRYEEDVREWDVVNEALDEHGQYRANGWMNTLGPRYVELAFRFAREADPTAKLIYNEYEADLAGTKRDATAHLVRTLKQKGLIDGVGLQMHRSLADAPTREQLEDTLRLYESMGLEVQITEMDVLAGGDTSLIDRLTLQAGAFRRAAEACAAVVACTRFTVWGVSDKYSWLGADQLPVLLDSSFAAKPALGAVREVLG
jgi:endo-1,4-beta-xylanase